MKTQVQFDTYPVNAALDPSGGYIMKLQDLQMVTDNSVFEEVVKEKTIPLSPELLEFAFKSILRTMSQKVSKDCRPRKIGNYLKAAPYLRGKLKGPYSAYDPETCSCVIVFSSLSGLDKTVNTDDYIQFVNSKTGTKVTIDRITYEGSGVLVGVIKKSVGIVVTGLNCQWLEGDSCTLAWKDAAGAAQTATITPTSSSVTEMRFAWPTALNDVAEGTEVNFHFLTRGGIEDSEPQPNDKVVTVIAADPTPAKKVITLTGLACSEAAGKITGTVTNGEGVTGYDATSNTFKADVYKNGELLQAAEDVTWNATTHAIEYAIGASFSSGDTAKLVLTPDPAKTDYEQNAVSAECTVTA